MLKMFAIVHAQSHSGTKGKIVRDENGNVKGYQKVEGNIKATRYTKKYIKAQNSARGGNTGTGGNGRG